MIAKSFENKEHAGLVSVVISTYHGEKYIAEALDSVAAQTYPAWEVVVVEDGSWGPTERIVKEFARRHPKHRVDYTRSPRNYGLGYTRNRTFDRCAGQFVAILDDDDRWLPDFLSSAVQAIQSSGKDIAYASSLMIEDQTNMVLGVWGPNSAELADFPQSLFGRCFLTPSATLFRRNILPDVGPWDEFRYAEDYSFWLRCVAANKQFCHFGGCHLLYRKNHPGAMTQSLCGTLEGVAIVTERYMNTPGMRPTTCRRFAAHAYALAASRHAATDPSTDPSADRSRAARLYWKAWTLRRNNFAFLRKAILHGVANALRRRQRWNPPEISPPVNASPVRMAA